MTKEAICLQQQHPNQIIFGWVSTFSESSTGIVLFVDIIFRRKQPHHSSFAPYHTEVVNTTVA